ncbi:MAG: indole-3-glycerol phosphate synthase TrpC [Gammaproteobacteria bacterium]|nr:indole-3-glycerol phosphate synthase TrpC [Gammaproteobacteria bacterium]
MHNYLQKILANKSQEVIKLMAQLASEPSGLMASIYHQRQSPRLLKSLKTALIQPGLNVIAEIKRRSPSKSAIAMDLDPLILADNYLQGGASAISVLTDYAGFRGSLDDLEKVSAALKNTKLPILRKDFLLEPIQIAEAIAHGADAVLLIVSVLQEKTAAMLEFARDCGIDALVEVHDKAELDYALRIGADIIGVNNRNLTSFKVNQDTARQLKAYMPESIVAVAESGIDSVTLAAEYAELGYAGVLMGESLVTQKNPADFIHQLKVAV